MLYQTLLCQTVLYQIIHEYKQSGTNLIFSSDLAQVSIEELKHNDRFDETTKITSTFVHFP